MRLRITNSLSETIQWYCEDELQIGDLVYANLNDESMISRSFKNRKLGDKLLGVSTVHVAHLDLTKHPSHARSDMVNVGNKIRILEHGDIVINRKYDKIPYGQPMYVSKKGKITWKKHGELIGWASSRQNKDGFFEVRIQITRNSL